MSIALDSPTVPPTPRALARGIRLTAVRTGLWRVHDPSGRMIGHLESVSAPEGVRWRARRFTRSTGSLRELGDFWSADDAVDCLRLSR
ncbi:hypothetical protein AB1K54_12360 [Microbacterium sp. BWT-B31]|uniref:hypothetical protein n=1 Tax=Microbacterium sp. BWT-B31 TaxID=3232072 RepID=UPI00352849B1